MNASEIPFVFSCAGEPLIGIVHEPAQPARTGVLIIVGGPQYRIGSHRQFLLIARALAAAGVPAMRFDYRGMGDSGGDYAGFEHVDVDIAAAIDAFMARHPSLREVVLWGLCDAASAALFYAHKDERVGGLVLVNPWVRTVAGEAKTYLKHYYWSRLVDGAFWRKVISGQFSVTSSLCSLLDLTKKARTREAHSDDRALPLPQRMAEGLRRFSGPVLLIISGNDLTAREFEDAAAASPLWRELLGAPRVISHRLDAADHTFSRREWRARVSAWTVAMVNQLPNGIAKA